MFKNQRRRRRFIISRHANGITSSIIGSNNSSTTTNSATSRCRSANNENNTNGGHHGGGPLTNFDACIETCDALAAATSQHVFHNGAAGRLDASSLSLSLSPPSSSSVLNQKNEETNEESNFGTGKSIMVSPDGELISCQSLGLHATTTTTTDNIDQDSNSNDDEHESHCSSSMNDTNQSSRTTMPLLPSQPQPQPQPASLSSSSIRDDEIESSIYIGNDAVLDGEKELNGFSARGWNPIMTTMAVRRAIDTLQTTGKFMEELILSHKNNAASASQACEHLRDMMVMEDLNNDHNNISNSNSNNHYYNNVIAKNNKNNIDHHTTNTATAINMNNVNENDSSNTTTSSSNTNDNNGMTNHQKSAAGPLLFPGSTLCEALVAIEKYYSGIAERDSHRWRMASNINSSIVNRTNSNGSSRNCSSDSNAYVIEGGLLPLIHKGMQNNTTRAERRERAILDSQEYIAESESNLRTKKEESKQLWSRVHNVEAEVNRKVEEKLRQRSRNRELKRRQEQNERQAALSDGKLNSQVTQQEIWDLVSQVGADGSFAPHDLPPPTIEGPIDQSLSQSMSVDSPPSSPQSKDTQPPSEIDDYRAVLEEENKLHELRVAALESDENVSDVAGKLLNAISTSDTTKRSARIAAETCLLSCANSQMKSLKSLVAHERSSLEERLKMIQELEDKMNKIDVRSDLNLFIEHDKFEVPNGTTKLGDNDDGGIASALATLNSFSEGINVGVNVSGMAELSSFTGWNEEDEEEVIDRDDLEEAVEALFQNSKTTDDEDFSIMLEKSLKLLEKAIGEKSIRGRGYRASTCYALNNHRGENTQFDNKLQFDGLCRMLDSLLDGCDREAADVANAKMVMMLAQTFYYIDNDLDGDDRTKRIYSKDKLCHNKIWLDEDFWTQALFQCVTDSLATSGVMVKVRVKKSERNRKMKWHDLNYQDRADAASQIHSIVFSQLGALAHSMVEFGCSVEQACAFVRRLSVRHQLPLSQRSMLLCHLLNRDGQKEQ